MAVPGRSGAPDRAIPRARPGFILSAMAFIFGLLVFTPLVGTLFVLYRNDALTLGNILYGVSASLGVLVHALLSAQPVTVALVLPTMLVFLVAIVFLVAFCFRAAWGPRILAALALIWALAVNASTVVVPLLGMSGSMPLLTFLGMVPGLVAPFIFALGFAGFLLQSDVAQAWFGTFPKDTSPQETGP